MPYMKIDGEDITRHIEMGGVSMSENDLDSPGAGRTLDGKMHRDKTAEKKKAEIKCVPIKKQDLTKIMKVLRNQYFVCETDLFGDAGDVALEMYNSTRKYIATVIDIEGIVWYTGVSFNIIER